MNALKNLTIKQKCLHNVIIQNKLAIKIMNKFNDLIKLKQLTKLHGLNKAPFSFFLKINEVKKNYNLHVSYWRNNWNGAIFSLRSFFAFILSWQKNFVLNFLNFLLICICSVDIYFFFLNNFFIIFDKFFNEIKNISFRSLRNIFYSLTKNVCKNLMC